MVAHQIISRGCFRFNGQRLVAYLFVEYFQNHRRHHPGLSLPRTGPAPTYHMVSRNSRPRGRSADSFAAIFYGTPRTPVQQFSRFSSPETVKQGKKNGQEFRILKQKKFLLFGV